MPIRQPGDADRVYLPHPEISRRRCEPGHPLLLDDGKVRLIVIDVAPQPHDVTRVEVGGKLSDRKGVSAAGFDHSALRLWPAKDRSDLEAALDAGIDWVALSFIQRPEDIAEAKNDRGRRALRDGQDREAAGGDAARRNHRARRRADGGARRPRRRDAARESARRPEADDAPGRAAPASRSSWRPRCWNR